MSRPERILVIEDEPSIRLLLTKQLEKEGYLVQTAEDGQSGMDAVMSGPPDLILLDIMMPRMDGHDVCRLLKSNHRTSQIPIIMLTAMAETKDKVHGLEIGANDYVTKPFEPRELLSRVKNLLQWGRIQRESNPLSGLPGNHMIEAELAGRIGRHEPWVFIYVDVDNFKAFNDFYSYQKGDEALHLTAWILRKVVEKLGTPEDFVGHVGGDDFVLILNPRKAREIADETVRRFDEEIPSLYSQVDRARGYIQTVNRQGQLEKFRLMTLTMAAVSSETRPLNHVAQVSDIAAELKRFGKEQPRSIVVWDRRVA